MKMITVIIETCKLLDNEFLFVIQSFAESSGLFESFIVVLSNL